MIIVNEIHDPRYLRYAAAAIDAHFAKLKLDVGISNGFATDIGLDYVICTFVCQIYPSNEPEDSQACDFKLIQVRLTGLEVDSIEIFTSPFH